AAVGAGLVTARRVLREIVAVGRVGAAAAAAADLRELAGAAAPAELRLAEIVEDGCSAPQRAERGPAQAAGGHRHVGARRHVALGRDAAVVLPRRARAVGVVLEQRRGGVELPEDAAEVRRALRADQEPVSLPDRDRPRVLE